MGQNLLTRKSLGFCRDKQEETATSLCCYKHWETKSSDNDSIATSKTLKICLPNKMILSFAVVCTKHSCSLCGLSTFTMKISDSSPQIPKEAEDCNDKSQPRLSHPVGCDVEENILAFRETTVSWDLSLDTEHCIFCKQTLQSKRPSYGFVEVWLVQDGTKITVLIRGSPAEMCLHDTSFRLRRFCRAGQSYLDAYYAADSRYFRIAAQPLSTNCFSTSSNTKANSALLSQLSNLCSETSTSHWSFKRTEGKVTEGFQVPSEEVLEKAASILPCCSKGAEDQRNCYFIRVGYSFSLQWRVLWDGSRVSTWSLGVVGWWCSKTVKRQLRTCWIHLCAHLWAYIIPSEGCPVKQGLLAAAVPRMWS